jgi:hypothetical protein
MRDEPQVGERVISVVVGDAIVLLRVPGDTSEEEITRRLQEMREKELSRQQG